MKFTSLKIGDVIWLVHGITDKCQRRLAKPEPYKILKLNKPKKPTNPNPFGSSGDIYAVPGIEIHTNQKVECFCWDEATDSDDRFFKTKALAWGAYFQKRQEQFDAETERLQRENT